ncbi:hypothetical protein G3I24_36190, partial [Micromonospora aurantiaca]|nr:hypothetical protein [Micromonospora aurantiaca]
VPTTAAGLPRRQVGGHLPGPMPDAAAPPPATDLLDPEVVRARLSALAEGVASATRRAPNTTTPNGRRS